MNAQTDIADILARLLKLLLALDNIFPSYPYLENFSQALTINEIYDAALMAEGVLRSMGSREPLEYLDYRAPILSDEIRLQVARLDSLCRIKFSPSSPQQKQSWTHTALRDPRAEYGLGDDGSLDISVLDSELRDSVLHVRRIWGRRCEFSGSWTDFKIRLDATQARDFRMKLAELRSVQFAINESRKAPEKQ
jgi:hypothetical protein